MFFSDTFYTYRDRGLNADTFLPLNYREFINSDDGSIGMEVAIKMALRLGDTGSAVI